MQMQRRELRIDPARSQITFRVRWLGPIFVRGRLEGVEGDIMLDQAEPERARVHATVKIATIATGIRKRDEHLRTAEFFDVDRYPLASFASDRVEPIRDGQWRVHGVLSLHGVDRPVTLDTRHEASEGGELRLFAKCSVRRRDFDIGGEDLRSRLMIGGRADLHVTVTAVPVD
jgi:polyisoprenoid-binding protein YceI